MFAFSSRSSSSGYSTLKAERTKPRTKWVDPFTFCISNYRSFILQTRPAIRAANWLVKIPFHDPRRVIVSPKARTGNTWLPIVQWDFETGSDVITETRDFRSKNSTTKLTQTLNTRHFRLKHEFTRPEVAIFSRDISSDQKMINPVRKLRTFGSLSLSVRKWDSQSRRYVFPVRRRVRLKQRDFQTGIDSFSAWYHF